jgi:hypothetical protein
MNPILLFFSLLSLTSLSHSRPSLPEQSLKSTDDAPPDSPPVVLDYSLVPFERRQVPAQDREMLYKSQQLLIESLLLLWNHDGFNHFKGCLMKYGVRPFP